MKKEQIHIRIEKGKLERWKLSRNVDNMSDRIAKLIEADTHLTAEEVDKQDIIDELTATNGEIDKLMNKVAVLKNRLAEIDFKEAEKKRKQKEKEDWQVTQEINLAHEVKIREDL